MSTRPHNTRQGTLSNDLSTIDFACNQNLNDPLFPKPLRSSQQRPVEQRSIVGQQLPQSFQEISEAEKEENLSSSDSRQNEQRHRMRNMLSPQMKQSRTNDGYASKKWVDSASKQVHQLKGYSYLANDQPPKQRQEKQKQEEEMEYINQREQNLQFVMNLKGPVDFLNQNRSELVKKEQQGQPMNSPQHLQDIPLKKRQNDLKKQRQSYQLLKKELTRIINYLKEVQRDLLKAYLAIQSILQSLQSLIVSEDQSDQTSDQTCDQT